FFFQAEDGIRDRNVTGVQTCALPISPVAESSSAPPASTVPASAASPESASPASVACPVSAGPSVNTGWSDAEASAADAPSSAGRSEERRVGTECRWRRWPAGGAPEER